MSSHRGISSSPRLISTLYTESPKYELPNTNKRTFSTAMSISCNNRKTASARALRQLIKQTHTHFLHNGKNKQLYCRLKSLPTKNKFKKFFFLVPQIPQSKFSFSELILIQNERLSQEASRSDLRFKKIISILQSFRGTPKGFIIES